jgi:hypothetical protein
MSADQVEMDNLLNGARTTGSEMLAEGAMLLRGFVTGAEAVYIYETVQRTLALAAFRHMMTPGGRRMSNFLTV